MSDQEGVYSSNILKQQAVHVLHPVSGHVDHAESHPHADDAKQLTVEKPQAELLRWHYRLVHLSFKMIKTMATVGLLTKRITTAPIPKCAGCMFAETTKNPWRKKGATRGHVGRKTNITRPGQYVPVDQLDSPHVGLIMQLKEIPTKKRYRYATIFVDHYYELEYLLSTLKNASSTTLRHTASIY